MNSKNEFRKPELGGETPPSAGEYGANTEHYIIHRSGSSAQALRTRHYILREDGSVAFRLYGSKREQVIWSPAKKGLRYHVEVYRTGGGNRQIEVNDMWTKEIVFRWAESYGIEELLTKAPTILREVIKNEIVEDGDP